MPMRDFGPKHLESQKKIASWRRCAKMILKNDYYGRGLSFSQTKRDDAELKAMLEKDEIENKIIYFNERLDKSDAKS